MPIGASPLVEVLAQAIQRDSPTLISIDGRGSISIYPRESAYITDIQNWEALPLSDERAIKTAPGVWLDAPPHARPVSELHWRVSYYTAVRNRERLSARLGTVRLLRWPDLSEIPQDLAEPIARICALLWRQPCAGVQVAPLLGMDARRTDLLIRTLCSLGYVEIAPSRAEAGPMEADAAAPVSALYAAPHALAQSGGGFWAMLRGR